MEYVFETTRRFDKDLERLDPPARIKVVKEINKLAQWFRDDNPMFSHRIKKVPGVKLPDGSSLYNIRIDQSRRLIATFDTDPLFDQIIVTLFRLVNRADLPKAFASVAQSLYQPTAPGPSDIAEDNVDGSD